MNEEEERQEQSRKNPPVRSAEKKRKFIANPFADHIAQLCLHQYQKLCPNELQLAFKQTVLAGIVLEILSPEAHAENIEVIHSRFIVASIGVGTKMAQLSQISQEKMENAGLGDRIVRDMHAEVLAKRGFQKFLFSILYRIIQDETISDNACFIFDRATHQVKLKENVRIHLYSSSQPCGNACIKRWATNKNSKIDIANPSAAHDPFFVTHRQEGQVSVLLKKNGIQSTEQKNIFTPIGDSLLTDGKIIFPIGTAPPMSNLGNIMTCSDKIAKWNALGLQGNLLSFFYSPLYLHSIIIGRKFSEIHCKRAICCRISSFHYENGEMRKILKNKKNKKTKIETNSIGNSNDLKDTPPEEVNTTTAINGITVPVHSKYFTHHPVCYGTAVKFDDSVLSVAVPASCTKEKRDETEDNDQQEGVCFGANFSEKRCFVSWRVSCDDHPETQEGNGEEGERYENEILDGGTGNAIEQFFSTVVGDSTTRKDPSTSLRSNISSAAFYDDMNSILSSLSDNNNSKNRMIITSTSEDHPHHHCQEKEKQENNHSISYEELKRLNIHYFQAQEFLFNEEEYLSGWIRKK